MFFVYAFFFETVHSWLHGLWLFVDLEEATKLSLLMIVSAGHGPLVRYLLSRAKRMSSTWLDSQLKAVFANIP